MHYKKEIKKVIEQNKKDFKIYKIAKLKIKELGIGENNYNFLVSANDQKFVFRICLRKELEKNMKREHESLKILPKNYGPKPIFFDNSKKILPKVFSVQSYIKGKHITKWSKKHLELHAKKLANLHKMKYDYCGMIYKKSTSYDLYKRLLKEINGYKKIILNCLMMRM